MHSFLEFYVTLLQFVNYKIFVDAGFVYPPKMDLSKDAEGAGLSAYSLTVADSENLTEILEEKKVKPSKVRLL